MGAVPVLLAIPSVPVRVHPDGTLENLGREQPDVHPRLAGPAAMGAQLLLRQQFGDLDRARDVLSRLAATLDLLDEPAPHDTQQ